MELSREIFLAVYFFTAEEEKTRDLFAFCKRKKICIIARREEKVLNQIHFEIYLPGRKPNDNIK